MASNDEKERVRDANNILDFFRETFDTQIKKNGSSYMARCPFHNEKTPSFHIRPQEGTFKCFGCGTRGDVFTLYMSQYRATFPDALEALAHRAGITLTRDYEGTKNRSNAFDALEEAARFFQKQLPDSLAEAYLRSRGINDSTISNFRIGYAPMNWRAIIALTPQISMEALKEGGLVKESERGPHGFFYHRVIFPIRNNQGRVIGFGGRKIDHDGPKYINTPQTAVFKKSTALYGLSEALDGIKKSNRVNIVEGYMDVVRAWQDGYRNVVAPMGTAFTRQQSEMLNRMFPLAEKVLCFNNDDAGKKATLKAAGQLLGLGDTSVCILPSKDLAQIAEEGGDIGSALEKRVALFEHYVNEMSKGHDTSTAEGKSTVLQAMKDDLQSIPLSQQGIYIDRLSGRLGIRPSSLESFLNKDFNKTRIRYSWEIRVGRELIASVNEADRRNHILTQLRKEDIWLPEVRAVLNYIQNRAKEADEQPLFFGQNAPLFAYLRKELQTEIKEQATKGESILRDDVLEELFSCNQGEQSFDSFQEALTMIRMDSAVDRFRKKTLRSIRTGRINLGNLDNILKPMEENDGTP